MAPLWVLVADREFGKRTRPTSQKVLEYTSIIAANPEAAFRVISDPRSKLLWVPAIGWVEIESDRPLGLGTPYLASAGIGPLKFVFREQIMEWVENRRVAYGGCMNVGEFKTEANIEMCEGGTRLNYHMDYILSGGRIESWTGRLLTVLYRQRVEAGTGERFKAVIEKSLWQSESE